MEIKDVQRLLVQKGFGPLVIDGKSGPKTTSAIKAFQTSKGLKADGIVGLRTAAVLQESVKPIVSNRKKRVATQKEMFTIFGPPGDSNLVYIQLPYPMRVSWSPGVSVKKMPCHKMVAEAFLNVFNDLLTAYGYNELKRLRIDLWGGTYNFRKMRGGSDWSKHSWGTAIDLDPERNSLRATKKTASFAKPEYKKMIEIFYKHGFVGLGPEKDYDWMHFEFGV